MQINIPYGTRQLKAVLPDDAEVLTITEPEAAITPDSFLSKVDAFIKQNALNLSDTIVVVADKTRLCGYPDYLPLLIEVLRKNGMAEYDLRFVIAYGTHPPQSDDDCLVSYGEVYRQYPFIHHDCRQTNQFVNFGTTSRGVPIRIRKDICQATCIITMGPICHHYFAGYGGGRKLIFPGCGEKESIYANHSLYLDRQKQALSATCQPGVLKGNPIAEDLFEIADHKEPDMAIHGIMNSHGKLSDVVMGNSRREYLQACAIHGSLCESSAPTYPLVIASCGGFPKDINFIQSHKAIHNAAMFVEDGGDLLIFSECRDGIGSKTFLPWYELGSFTAAFQKLCLAYEGNGGTALAMMSKTARIKIRLVTELDPSFCSITGVEKMDLTQASAFIQAIDSKVCYIPNSSLLVRKTE